tara:strand:+ start:3203 stop:4111 length:909 start_codon:yes stop_codon:yes gene_type:complete
MGQERNAQGVYEQRGDPTPDRTMESAQKGWGEAERDYAEYEQKQKQIDDALNDLASASATVGQWLGDYKEKQGEIQAGKNLLSSEEGYKEVNRETIFGGEYDKDALFKYRGSKETQSKLMPWNWFNRDSGVLLGDKFYNEDQVRTLGKFGSETGLSLDPKSQQNIIKNWQKVEGGGDSERGLKIQEKLLKKQGKVESSPVIENIKTETSGGYVSVGKINMSGEANDKGLYTGEIFEKDGKQYLKQKTGGYTEVYDQQTRDYITKQLGGKKKKGWARIFDIFKGNEIDVKVGTGGYIDYTKSR